MAWGTTERRDRPHREVPTPERAIDAACRYDVYGVGTGPLSDSIDREQIAVIYAMWEEREISTWHFRLTHYPPARTLRPLDRVWRAWAPVFGGQLGPN